MVQFVIGVIFGIIVTAFILAMIIVWKDDKGRRSK